MGLSACTGEIDSSDGSGSLDRAVQNAGHAKGKGTVNWWRQERALRQAEVEGYIADNLEDYQWFKNAPLGNSGIPMIMFRLFPELFPAVWGAPSDHFAPVGLAQDTLEPSRVLPLGLGYTGSQPPIATPVGPINLQVVQLSCMGCHSGRVIGPDGDVQHIIGGPSTTFNQFRVAVSRTVNHPAYTADNFRAALASKPLGWLYGDPSMMFQEYVERAVFMSPGGAETFLATLKSRANAGAARSAATLGTYTYADTPNAPSLVSSKPGYLDAIGAGITIIVDPALYTPEQLDQILPPAPAEIDIMSVWLQADRPRAQWDGSITSPLHRNLAAEFGVVGNPLAISLENGVRTTRFTENLPATPYPFDVQRDAAARGQHLYEQNCAGCHAPGNDRIFGIDEIGTDPNRAILWSPFTVAGLINVLRMGCSDASVCSAPDGSPLPGDQILSPTYGYMAVPLDGIWARAPYLHNGSVPTLHALMTGERPAQFWRGNLTYDQAKVGFTWDTGGPYAAIFDTTLSGASNGGHDTPEFLGGVDWANEPRKLADLLEYMKTL